MSRTTRSLAAAFDAVAMALVALLETGGRFRNLGADVALWGSAVAAALVALAVASAAPPLFAFVGIGYVLFAAVFTGPVHVVLLLLAIALVPIARDPRAPLGNGLLVTALSAVAFRLLVPYLF